MAANAKNIIKYREKDGYVEVTQSEGPTLGYSPESGAKIIVKDGYAFKSFDGSDTLYPYEDWRLPAEERAADLAGRLSMEEIAGLMLYSPQNRVPMAADSYDGKPFAESCKPAWSLSDGQRKYLSEDHLRHLLVSVIKDPETAARWNNAVQAYVEGLDHGIPANNSSDPRHSAFHDAEFSPGSQGQLSLWSHLTGLACTFDPELVREFAETMRAEYRALGLCTALSPQADLGTDPRWYRYASTFGNDPQLVADLTREYTDGLQSSPESADGSWGTGSVNAMAKHWPGGGSGEGGRDAHYGNGKFAVYPGGCYETHKYPFTHGAFALKGATGKASAIMPYYTISSGHSHGVGNSYDADIVTRQLRQECGYDGVVCTDWVITADQIDPGTHSGKPWGVETLTVAERHYRALKAGVDQFGGNNDKGPVLEAYRMGCAEFGEEHMRQRMETSARRLLVNIFRPGLFENPYVDVDASKTFVGNSELMRKGYEQQIKSVVMLKNSHGTLPLKDGKVKVYVPERNLPAMRNYWGGTDAAQNYRPVTEKLAAGLFELTYNAEDADAAIVFMDSPKSYRMGYDPADVEQGGNGYIPISLQYRPYQATEAREHSLMTDPAEPVKDRSYKDKWARTQNECDLDLLERTRREMGDKPVIVIVSLTNPLVLAEVEPLSDAILVGFSVQTQAYLDLICGKSTPSGLLPFEMPASMEAIERHNEDMPHDIEPYTDKDGNVYEFGFGLDFKGRIRDARTARYCK